MLLQSIDGKHKGKGSCGWQEILCCSFLQEMEYWGAREQVKILGKSDGECPREVQGACLGCGGTYFEYRWQWEYYFFIRQWVKMAGKWRWWAILFWGWYGRYICRLIFDSYTNYMKK